IIQSTIAHELALIDFTIFTEFQENILPDKYSVTVFMNHNESINHYIFNFVPKMFIRSKDDQIVFRNVVLLLLTNENKR
ncbi:MAG: hypothetical protein AB7U98_16310, partial [Candidatus Nitrosocosmicus sp.]